MKNFYNTIKTTSKYRSIKDYWKIEVLEDVLLINQINSYFNKLEELIKNENNMREALIIKVSNSKDEAIIPFMEKMNSLEETYNMPLVLLLYEKGNENKLELDFKNYKNIDPRLIFSEKYDENRSNIEDKIEPILLRFCSIHNELGDRITINNKEDYDLINDYFPFNLNIACIGRFGQGKSTGVNSILKEYKAKESSKGVSQTKSLTFYQVSKQPIRILDIPGFENENTVKQAIEKFKICGDKIKKIKDNLHIILYFLNYYEKRAFMKLEIPMLEEILKHKSSKLIYIITHSPSNLNDKKKDKVINRINSGLKGIFGNTELKNDKMENKIFNNSLDFEIIEEEDNSKEKKINNLTSTLDNTVFVNFHKDNDDDDDDKINEPFGEDLLFQKIYQSFIESEDYKNFGKKLDSKTIENRALRLRAQAKDIILSNKIWGAVVGLIPGIDWALQKFVIKKNAAKKIGKIFGIEVKFIKESEKEKKMKNKKGKNEKKNNGKEEIINTNIDEDALDLEIEGQKLTEESTQYKVGNSIKITTEASAYIGSGISRAATEVMETASISIRIAGAGLAVAGALLGVSLGGYFTSKYCEDLLDKFVQYYKKNAEKIENSYKKAAEYFSSANKNNN